MFKDPCTYTHTHMDVEEEAVPCFRRQKSTSTYKKPTETHKQLTETYKNPDKPKRNLLSHTTTKGDTLLITKL